MSGTGLRERLARTHLYLVCPASPGQHDLETILSEAVLGGAGVIQLRDHEIPDLELLEAARVFRRVADQTNAIFIVNDRPDIALLSGADGVHVGQDDLPPGEVRKIIGDDLLLGLSTHTTDQIAEAQSLPVDYIGVGPVFETPTKAGRAGVGLKLIESAAMNSRIPFFAIGGIDSSNAAQVAAAGGAHIAVVRAIVHSSDPREAATALLSEVSSG